MKGRSNVMCYFDPDEYVRSHCESYRSGTISDRDIETIKIGRASCRERV